MTCPPPSPVPCDFLQATKGSGFMGTRQAGGVLPKVVVAQRLGLMALLWLCLPC